MAPPAGQLPPLAPGFEWQYDWSLPELAFGPVTTSLTKIILPPDFPALLKDSQGPQIGSGHKQTKARGTYACSKAARAGDKNAGSVFEQRNALARLRAHFRDEVRNRPR